MECPSFTFSHLVRGLCNYLVSLLNRQRNKIAYPYGTIGLIEVRAVPTSIKFIIVAVKYLNE